MQQGNSRSRYSKQHELWFCPLSSRRLANYEPDTSSTNCPVVERSHCQSVSDYSMRRWWKWGRWRYADANCRPDRVPDHHHARPDGDVGLDNDERELR